MCKQTLMLNTPEKLQRRRETREFRRRRKRRDGKLDYININGLRYNSTHGKRLFNLHVENSLSTLYKYLKESGFYSENLAKSRIEIPEEFSFDLNYDSTLVTIKIFFSSIYKGIIDGDLELELSFKHCKYIDYGALLVITSIIIEYEHFNRRLKHRLHGKSPYKKIFVYNEMDKKIKNLLHTMRFPVNLNLDNDLDSIPILGLIPIRGKKSRQDYRENSKTKTSRQVREFINASLVEHKFELNADGENLFESLIGEVLTNAEDHNAINYWYACGSLLKTRSNSSGNNFGELNLVFLNYGDSISEGFKKTKDKNEEMYLSLQDLFNNVKDNYSKKIEKLSWENLLTLYGLQEGYSRLKHEDESRGTGTMTFIRSFIELGDYSSRNVVPKLYILSGETLIKCDPSVKPFKLESKYFLSLNKEKDLTKPPSLEYIRNNKESFPGTLLLVKVFLNEKHLASKI